MGAPRSGTTLMQTLLNACFEIDGVMETERRLWRTPGRGYEVLCSKRPGDEALAPGLIHLDRAIWFIYMLRDPRDTIVSRHPRAPDVYWSNLDAFKTSIRFARKVWDHPRFLVVKYEDLAKDADAVQTRLSEAMPFLDQKAKFSDFHRVVGDGDVAQKALGPVRPINKASIGAWRNQMPRIKAQLQIHGSIAGDLIDLGYEKDESWLAALEDVSPENAKSLRPEYVGRGKQFRRAIRRQIHRAIYLSKRLDGEVATRFAAYLHDRRFRHYRR